MRHFIVVEENADRLYKKTYFFNEILKIQFFPTNCFSNTAKAVEIKIISPMNFCSDRILCLSKNQSLKAVNPQKKCEQYHFFTEKCIFLKKIHTLIILAMPNGTTIFFMPSDVIQVIYPYTKKHVRFWLFHSLFSSNGQNKISRHFSKQAILKMSAFLKTRYLVEFINLEQNYKCN